MAKKTWKKPVSIVMDIGPCRYCKKDMVNTESFVAFADGTKSHYLCMKNDDELKEQTQNVIEKIIEKQLAEDKTYE